MTTSPTENTEELRGQISNLMADLMLETKLIKLANQPDMLKQGRQLIKTHNSRLDAIMSLIASSNHQAVQAFVEQVLKEKQTEGYPPIDFVPVSVITSLMKGGV